MEMISEIPGHAMVRCGVDVVWCVVRYDDVTYLVLVLPPLLMIIVLLHNNGE